MPCTDTIGLALEFWETEKIGDRGENGRPETSEDTIKQGMELFHNDSSLSICAPSSRLQLSLTKEHRTFAKMTLFVSLKLQDLQALNERDTQKLLEFAGRCITQSQGYLEYLSKLLFSDGNTFTSTMSTTSRTQEP